MLEERTATFHSINEGVIAIDNQHMITIFNEKAKQIFGVTGDVVGRNIWGVLSDTRLPEIIDRAEPVYNEEIHMSGKRIMSSRIPIVMKKIIGAVAIFRTGQKRQNWRRSSQGLRTLWTVCGCKTMNI